MSQYRPKSLTRFLVITLASLLLTLAGCTTEKPGNPTPSTPAPSSPGQNSSAAPADIFGDLKACDLLEPISSSLGFDPPAIETYESENGCGSSKPRYGTVAVYLVPNAGIADLKSDTGEVKQTSIAGREAVELPGSAGKGACLIGIAVAEKARVTVNLGLSNSGTTEQACTDARSIAEQIAPKLPRGN
ncbi:DUF3558 family protein [Amycolatopsis pittospori]|uniref:DUF3558 family protein n=1 Tax=Amycolatopsis pittospori TaxID=2749434 RepID=UPI0015F082B8|nr:DUF3558 family protein [Amycolatopsis pittospori]